MARPKAVETDKPIYPANPAPMSQDEREAFRREMMAKYSQVIAYLGR
ncbi:MAG TPA: hypothetical protein VHD34_11455 [Xanthobacteraceae bacterium]|nr:hypothetical protein [Xanthobacteraceae bacterium]